MINSSRRESLWKMPPWILVLLGFVHQLVIRQPSSFRDEAYDVF